jgi:muramidase (phage lysozyme)
MRVGIKQQYKKLKRRMLKKWRQFARQNRWTLRATAGSLLVLGGAIMYVSMTAPKVDPSAYTPLLNTIAKGESNGNYNAHFGNANNMAIRFTDMSVGDVLKWQEKYVHEGSASSAVGKYQIIRSTLQGLVSELDIDQDAKFDAALQDKMAIALLERRGSLDFVDNKLTREQFAANLAKEWAALPKVVGDNPNESFYASDGLNQARISIQEVYFAIGSLKREG